jgi:hypothetical protein
MTTLTAFFASLALSLPSRVLTALSIGWVSYEGYKNIIDDLVTKFTDNYNSMPSAIYQLLSLAGFTDGLGLILAAFAAKAAIYGIKTLGNVTT